jgi:hypothetical protein
MVAMTLFYVNDQSPSRRTWLGSRAHLHRCSRSTCLRHRSGATKAGRHIPDRFGPRVVTLHATGLIDIVASIPSAQLAIATAYCIPARPA